MKISKNILLLIVLAGVSAVHGMDDIQEKDVQKFEFKDAQKKNVQKFEFEKGAFAEEVELTPWESVNTKNQEEVWLIANELGKLSEATPTENEWKGEENKPGIRSRTMALNEAYNKNKLTFEAVAQHRTALQQAHVKNEKVFNAVFRRNVQLNVEKQNVDEAIKKFNGLKKTFKKNVFSKIRKAQSKKDLEAIFESIEKNDIEITINISNVDLPENTQLVSDYTPSAAQYDNGKSSEQYKQDVSAHEEYRKNMRTAFNDIKVELRKTSRNGHSSIIIPALNVTEIEKAVAKRTNSMIENLTKNHEEKIKKFGFWHRHPGVTSFCGALAGGILAIVSRPIVMKYIQNLLDPQKKNDNISSTPSTKLESSIAGITDENASN